MSGDILVDPVTQLICESAVLDYDPGSATAVVNFCEVSRRTHCMFAAKASMWGTCEWDEDSSLEGNLRRSLPALRRFAVATSRNEVEIFVIEVKGTEYFASLDEFGRTVWRVLKVVSDNDPKAVHALDCSLAGRTDQGWIMSFGGLPMFVLTFCPLYTATHSRHMFGTNPSSCFLLLQSGSAFDDVGEFSVSAETLMALPDLAGLSDRDRIRARFLRAGCPFNTEHSHCVVRPLDDFEEEEPHWWEARGTTLDTVRTPEWPELGPDASLDDLVAAELERSRKSSPQV